MSKNIAETALKMHYTALRTESLKAIFASNPNRLSEFSADIAGLFVDYSKNWVTEETISLLCDYAREKKLPRAIDALFSGEKINISEQRAAMHWALRLPSSESCVHEGQSITKEVQAVIQKMAVIAEEIKEKKLLGVTGKPIDTILHVGIGGSGLGPQLYYESMVDDPKNAVCYFLTDFDFPQIQSKLKQCDPEKTIAVIVSKSFGTEETLTIFETIRQWFGDEAVVKKQSYAVTAKTDRALAKGFAADNILPFWDFVGGRYSIWSAVNFANVLAFGADHFDRFLKGAHAMDVHFKTAPFEKNMPVILALIAFWYNNFFQAYSKAVVPYSAALRVFPAYLQQLLMESLGKNVSMQGDGIQTPTGQIIWGDVGPNSQHGFHQLLMQGSHLIPIDFILPFYHDALNEYDLKRAAYCLSQSKTLMEGCTGDAYQTIAGDRPSTTILIRHFSPETLGALLALYEHQVYVKSVMWDVNPFDQWGVERGKTVAKEMLSDIASGKVVDGLMKKILQD